MHPRTWIGCLLVVGAVGCGKTEVQAEATQSLRMTVVQKTPGGARFETMAQFGLIAGTTTANNLPDAEYEVTLQLMPGTLDGEMLIPRFEQVRGMTVSDDGQTAVWRATMTSGSVPSFETKIRGDASVLHDPACASALPVSLTTTYTIRALSSNVTLTAPPGTLTETTTAFVSCEGATP